MPVTNAGMDALAEELQAPLEDKHDPVIVQMIQHVRKTLPKTYASKPRTDVVQVIRGGSLYKGTAVKTKFDVDLVFLVGMSIGEFMDRSTQSSLRAALYACLDEHEHIEVLSNLGDGNKFPSAKCKLRGVDFDVLVGVSMVRGRPTDDWSMRQLDAVQKYILECSCYMQAVIAARGLSSSICQSAVTLVRTQTDTVKKAIVLLKQWRDFERSRDARFGSLKSFFLEIIAMAAAGQLRSKGSQRLTVRKIVEESFRIMDLSNCSNLDPRFLTIAYLGLYGEEDWADWILDPEKLPFGLRRRLYIVNPMTPVLSLLHSVPSNVLRGWSEAAELSLARMQSPLYTEEDIFGVAPGRSKAMLAMAEVQLPARRRRS